MINKKTALLLTGLFLLISCTPKKENIFKAIDRNSIRQVKKIVEMYPDVIEMQIDENDKYVHDFILLYASDKTNPNSEVIEYLLIKSQERDLNSVIFDSFLGLLKSNDFETCDLFIENGFDINYTRDSFSLGFISSGFNDNIEALKYLIEKGLDFNLYEDPHPPLYSAAQHGYTEVVRLMIEAGADVNIEDFNGETPLYAAIRYNHIDIVKMLLEAGANPEKKQ